jgi:hypothetical protein
MICASMIRYTACASMIREWVAERSVALPAFVRRRDSLWGEALPTNLADSDRRIIQEDTRIRFYYMQRDSTELIIVNNADTQTYP